MLPERSVSKRPNKFSSVSFTPRTRKNKNPYVKRIAGNSQRRLGRLFVGKCEFQEQYSSTGEQKRLKSHADPSPSPRRVINKCKGLNNINIPPVKLRNVNKKTVLEKRNEILWKVEADLQEENNDLKLQKDILEAELTAMDQFLYWQEAEMFELECAVAEEDLLM